MSGDEAVTIAGVDAQTSAGFFDDGVVRLAGALKPETLAQARRAFDWSLAHPGPGAATLPDRNAGTFYQDLANPAALERYRGFVRDSEIGDIVAALWGTRDVWFMYEQVFAKSGGDTRRTPWHQDTPYLPVRGLQLAVMWMSFEPVAAEQALEFVRGSHRGLIYDGSRFDPEDDTAPLYDDGSLPRLPDIEAERGRWPIVSWPTEPGDVLVFHPSMLHGGGATRASTSRHTLSLRFFGPDAVVSARPGHRVAELATDTADATAHPLTRMRALPDGAPFRDPGFPQIRP
jgi:ectoine hydroxylase-related dioxygenase (phytanoyl-CoA dioxygenase family)